MNRHLLLLARTDHRISHHMTHYVTRLPHQSKKYEWKLYAKPIRSIHFFEMKKHNPKLYITNDLFIRKLNPNTDPTSHPKRHYQPYSIMIVHDRQLYLIRYSQSNLRPAMINCLYSSHVTYRHLNFYQPADNYILTFWRSRHIQNLTKYKHKNMNHIIGWR